MAQQFAALLRQRRWNGRSLPKKNLHRTLDSRAEAGKTDPEAKPEKLTPFARMLASYTKFRHKI